jgi:hypothetical protein
MMAKIKLNPVFEHMRGQIGELVFKHYGDDVIVARKPDLSDKEPTAAQVAARERFRQAVLYGKMVVADPASKTLYDAAARVEGKPMFSLAVADFYHAPEVTEVDLSSYGGAVGDEIVVYATDDFGVTAMALTVADADGNLLEQGPALETPAGSGRWVYPATVAVAAGTTVRLTVTVQDRPGNVTTHEIEETLL